MDNWIVYGSDSSSSQPNFNDALNTTTRRHHSKSRKGCLTCKQRRIKCDETKPACRQCVDYGRHCSFLDSPSPPPRPPAAAVATQSAQPSFEDVVDQVWTRLQTRRDLNDIPDIALRRPHVRMILDHFLHRNDPWLHGPEFQSLVQMHGIRIGLESEYVLHAILAVTSAHMYYENQNQPDLQLISQCHYSVALELYQEKLKNIRAQDLDAIYVCGMLQVVMTIRSTLLDAATGSDMLKGYDILLTAIKTMDSFPALASPFNSLREFTDNVFYSLFTRCDFLSNVQLGEEYHAPVPSNIAPLEGLLRAVAGYEVFDGLYAEPFAYLIRISTQELRLENLDIAMSFSSQLKDGYLEALESREPIAILFLCYWFALLSRINQWWITESARTFCERFYVHLLGALPVPAQERSALLSPATQALGWGSQHHHGF